MADIHCRVGRKQIHHCTSVRACQHQHTGGGRVVAPLMNERSRCKTCIRCPATQMFSARNALPVRTLEHSMEAHLCRVSEGCDSWKSKWLRTQGAAGSSRRCRTTAACRCARPRGTWGTCARARATPQCRPRRTRGRSAAAAAPPAGPGRWGTGYLHTKRCIGVLLFRFRSARDLVQRVCMHMQQIWFKLSRVMVLLSPRRK